MENVFSPLKVNLLCAEYSMVFCFLSEIQESVTVEYGPMVSILVGQCSSKERANRLTAIRWVQEFITLGGEKLLLFYSDLLSAIMHCIR